MSASPSLASRAFVAVALLVGFYLFAILIAALLFSVPFGEYAALHRVDIRLVIPFLAAGVAILWALVPRPDRFVAPGPVLERERNPRLFAELESIAHATDQTMPVEVFLVPDVSGWVSERGGFMGFGARRVMGLGLPLLQALSVSELRAVLAHEFGHYHAGDTRLGPWLYKTRGAIGRTLHGLRGRGLFQKPFVWYGNMFLRITHGVSRAQEFAADALAARVAGGSALQSGLRRIHGAAGTYDYYWQSEVLPVLHAGYRPPVADGFARFLVRPAVASAIATHVEKALREEKSDPYDTHPPMADRIAAVAGIGSVAEALDDRPALSLLGDVEAMERELLMFMSTKPDATAGLVSVAWENVGSRVVLPAWQEAVAKHAEALSTIGVEDLPCSTFAVDVRAQVLVEHGASLPAEERRARALWVLGAAVGLLLTRSGCAIRSLPGEPVTLTTLDGDFDPMGAVQSVAEGKMSESEWREKAVRLGIAGQRLSEAPATNQPHLNP